MAAYLWPTTDPVTCVGASPIATVPDLTRLPRLVRLRYLTPQHRWTSLVPARSAMWTEELQPMGISDAMSVLFDPDL
ncbi:hypothetical protein ACFWCF_13690 [Rhodococcus sp. NPDC060090]|uniref:hypothetical protein n=1 Tax=Rhodococcus sp. NPDC060090 TaxID=3347056 RepID=UPI0036537F23